MYKIADEEDAAALYEEKNDAVLVGVLDDDPDMDVDRVEAWYFKQRNRIILGEMQEYDFALISVVGGESLPHMVQKLSEKQQDIEWSRFGDAVRSIEVNPSGGFESGAVETALKKQGFSDEDIGLLLF